ncbi:MAG TPA: hypothetical protein VE010_12855, partial [Thermoanaerobaculia bacterium]|nr:hypothetical protein [Thermoanaerobaculia bacterium]
PTPTFFINEGGRKAALAVFARIGRPVAKGAFGWNSMGAAIYGIHKTATELRSVLAPNAQRAHKRPDECAVTSTPEGKQ